MTQRSTSQVVSNEPDLFGGAVGFFGAAFAYSLLITSYLVPVLMTAHKLLVG